MKPRIRKPKTDAQKLLKQVRKELPTHVIEVELKITPSKTKYLNQTFEHARVIRNTALGGVKKRYDQMVRTKKYNAIKKAYRNVCLRIEKTKSDGVRKSLEQEKKQLSTKLNDLIIDYGITFDYVRKQSEQLQKKFSKAHSVVALTMAERAWSGMERLLYGNAEKVTFYAKDKLRSIEGKQNSRGIMLKTDNKEKKFYLSIGGEHFPLLVNPKDLFIQETLTLINDYLKCGHEIDWENIQHYKEEKPLVSTYRIKYNRIIHKVIRGKDRFFVQIVLEGLPVVKRKKDGSFRHTLGTGRLGIDIGTQSIALVTDTYIELKNLAERTSRSRERTLINLQRALDRSRRANNPDNYNKNSTVKKGKKTWIKSKRYQKKQKKLQNLHRILAENRKYAHNEDVNMIRSKCDVSFVEIMNFQGLQKRAKETTINEKTGKINKKKRYGKSILNRSPAYYVKQMNYRFEVTGGHVQKVNTWTFKASQYDHTLDDTNKKQLSKRWHVFDDGTKIQRDLYSAFLLYCSNETFTKPNKVMCDERFKSFTDLHDQFIIHVQQQKKHIKNSGIKIS